MGIRNVSLLSLITYQFLFSVLGQTSDFTITDNIHVKLLNDVNSESIKEGGYVEVDFKGKMDNFENNCWEIEVRILTSSETPEFPEFQKAHIFPTLEGQDIPVLITLSVITPYRAGVEVPILEAGEHNDMIGKELISNNFNSGDKKIKVSNVDFKVIGPTVLVLDS